MGWEKRLERQRRAEQEVKAHRAEKRVVGTQNRLRAEEDARTGMSRNAAAQVRPPRLDQTAEEQRAEKEKRAAKKKASQQFRQQAKLLARSLEADAAEAVAPEAVEAPEPVEAAQVRTQEQLAHLALGGGGVPEPVE